MTREEAITYGKRVIDLGLNDETQAFCEMAIKALEQETCDDVISRQAVLAAMRKNHRSGGRDIDGNYIEGDYRECLYDDIISLPPVTPQPKTGHWIKISPAGIYECSECGQNVMTSDICAYKFCHGCSAKMIEPYLRVM